MEYNSWESKPNIYPQFNFPHLELSCGPNQFAIGQKTSPRFSMFSLACAWLASKENY
jgi:hypothetical protein